MTAAWLALLPYAEPEDVREWLGEGGAWALHQRGVRDVTDPEAAEQVAEVLTAIHGADPMALE